MRFLVDANVPLSVAPPARENFRSSLGRRIAFHQTSNIAASAAFNSYFPLPTPCRVDALPKEHHPSGSLETFRYNRLRNSFTDIPASLTIPPMVSAFTGL